MTKENKGQNFESDLYPKHFPFVAKSGIWARRCQRCKKIVFTIAEEVKECRKCLGKEFD